MVLAMKVIGLMSGTSIDGIDAVIMETDGLNQIRVIAKKSLKYEDDFKISLKAEELKVRAAKKNIASQEVIKKSTELHANLVLSLLDDIKLPKTEITAIGYHGQTLYHKPEQGVSIQIGDAEYLYKITGISVVYNFRGDDIKKSGQGAPLAPIYHQALAARDKLFPLVVVNCGGISNISVIYGKDSDQVVGFDTGPGNALIDALVRENTKSQEFFDQDGKYGLKGDLNIKIFELMISNFKPYMQASYPKSLDLSDFSLPEEIKNISFYDACATLEAFTAFCIVAALDKLDNSIKLDQWILAGGGWYNPVILKYLKKFLEEKIPGAKIILADEIGWDQQYLEAEIFAFLAARAICGMAVTLPEVTGAIKPGFASIYTR